MLLFWILGYYSLGTITSAVMIRLKKIQPVNGRYLKDKVVDYNHVVGYKDQKFTEDTQLFHQWLAYAIVPITWPFIVLWYTVKNAVIYTVKGQMFVINSVVDWFSPKKINLEK